MRENACERDRVAGPLAQVNVASISIARYQYIQDHIVFASDLSKIQFIQRAYSQIDTISEAIEETKDIQYLSQPCT